MKFKRLMALAMAGVMTLGMAGTALAEDATTTFKKKVDIAAGLTSDSVGFTIAQLDKDPINGVTKAADVAASIEDLTGFTSADSDGKTATIKFAGGFAAPGVYAYTMKEKPQQVGENEFGWSKTDDTEYLIRVLVKAGENGNEDPVYLVYKPDENGTYGTDKKYSKVDDLTIENAWTAKAGKDEESSFELTKKVEGTGADYSADTKYQFKVTVTVPTSATKTTYTVDGDAKDDKGAAVKNITSGSELVLYLENGKTAQFKDLPVGTTVAVTEVKEGVMAANTKTTIAYTENGDEKDVTGDNVTECSLTLGEGKNNAIYTNKYEDITETGLVMNLAPFVAMFAAVAGAIALYIAAKRRVR